MRIIDIELDLIEILKDSRQEELYREPKAAAQVDEGGTNYAFYAWTQAVSRGEMARELLTKFFGYTVTRLELLIAGPKVSRSDVDGNYSRGGPQDGRKFSTILRG